MLNSRSGVRLAGRQPDALLLVVLVLARLRIDSLADAAVLPTRQADVAHHPLLGHVLPAPAMTLLAQQQWIDPIGLLLIVGALACLLAYLLVSEFVRYERTSYRAKLVLIWTIVLLTIFAPSLKLTLLRQASGPASYSHDGGVIQTEATIDFLLRGRNPYVEDYTQTAMAEWGINEFRTALYHYPYLPWTFLFSAPFKLLADATIGWYDQRFVYLLLFALTLLLLPGLCRQGSAKLILVMAIGLNPIMGSDLIYGQNDSFVLAWIVLSLWLWCRGRAPTAGRGWALGSSLAFGLACASKSTAWFLAPFYVLAASAEPSAMGSAVPWRITGDWLGRVWRWGWPVLAVVLLITGPYFLWNPVAMVDDVWRWSNGTSPTAYQVWGWGASNLVLALGWVKDRFSYWPFWAPELILGVPVLCGLLWRQMRDNSLARALWGYGIFLFAFFFVSRFLNENYLGFILAFFVLGASVDTRAEQRESLS